MPWMAVGALIGGVMGAGAGVIAAVGLGVQVVGRVTKSKELSQMGAGMSLYAGAVSLAGGIADAAGAAEGLGSAGAGSGDVAFDAWATEQGAAEMAAGGGAEAFGGSTPSWGDMGSAATEGLATSQPSGLLGSSTSTAPPSTAKFGEVRQFGDAAAEQSMAGEVASAIDKVGAIAPPTGTDPGSISQWWSNLPEARKNMVLQMGGKAVGGLFEGWTQEQKMAFERERFNLEQQKYNTSVSNANAQPTTIKPPVGGLLNAKRG